MTRTAAPRPEFKVEVVFAWPDQVHSSSVQVAPGTTVSQAVASSGVLQGLPREVASGIGYGIFGESVRGDRQLVAGDRIELLRPLCVDPKEARRRRARIRANTRPVTRIESSGVSDRATR